MKQLLEKFNELQLKCYGYKMYVVKKTIDRYSLKGVKYSKLYTIKAYTSKKLFIKNVISEQSENLLLKWIDNRIKDLERHLSYSTTS